MIWEKAKSLYDNLKQEECEGSMLENLMPTKDGLIILERGLTAEAASAHQEGADKFPCH